jgi:hypothetical protein
MSQPRFYVKALRKGWEICDRQSFDLPVHDNAPHGQDAPVFFTDPDIANEVCDDMNRHHDAGETVN